MTDAFCLGLVACLLAACLKDPAQSSEGMGEMTEVVISCDPGGREDATRAVPESWESNIADLQVLVFSPRDSSLTAYARVAGKSLSMPFVAGWEYIIYGVANSHNDLSDVVSIADLLSRTTRMEYQRKNCLEMIGQTGLMMINPAIRIRLPMERIVAKLQIKDFTMSITCDDVCVRSFEPDWLCIDTLPLEVTYGFKPTPSSWVSSGIVTSDEMDIPFDRIYGEIPEPDPVPVLHTVSPYMYTLPDDSGKLTRARYVAVKGFGIGADDRECWHCVRFKVPSMQHNKCYTITRLNLHNIVKNDHDIVFFENLETRSGPGEQPVGCYDASADYELEVSDMSTGEILEKYEAHY